MPETTLLQIRGPNDTEPSRAVELHGLSVRIGRGPQCEVRLIAPEFAPVQCLLRRRGPVWHLHPVGPKNLVWLEGSILSTQRILDLGAEFSVGAYRLTLHQTTLPQSEWDSRTPVTPEVERDDPRASWAKARLEERRWEVRWRSVGEQVKSRAASAQVPVPGNRSALVAIAAERRPTTEFTAQRRTLGSATAFAVELIQPSLERDSFEAELAEATSVLLDVDECADLDETSPCEVFAEHAENLCDPLLLNDVPPLAPVEQELAFPEEVATTVESPAEVLSLLPLDLEPEVLSPEAVISVEPPSPVVDAEVIESWDEAVEPELVTLIPEQLLSIAEPELVESLIQVEPDSLVLVDLTPPAFFRETTRPHDPIQNDRTIVEPIRVDPEPLPTQPLLRPRSRPTDEWPSTRSILGQAQTSVSRLPTLARPVTVDSSLTLDVKPNQWKIPVLLAAPVSLLFFLSLSSLGLMLSWQWMLDDVSAGKLIDHLLANVPKATLENDVVELPEPVWWRTQANSTQARAAAIVRATDDLSQARPWLQAVRSITPVHAATRFAEARLTELNGDSSLLSVSTGLSRDVLSLTWTGHQLAEAGKVDAALAAYSSALKLATLAKLERLPAPQFNDDDQIRRYHLPYESLIGPVIRDMAGRSALTTEQWTRAIPDVAVAKLAMARVLADRKDSSESLALASALEPSREAVPAAEIDAAVHAETLALQRNFAQAETSYKEAIEQMGDSSIKRSWWINVAEIDRKLEDRKGRREALELAKSLRPGDEITRRAVELQELDGRPVIERQTAYHSSKESR